MTGGLGIEGDICAERHLSHGAESSTQRFSFISSIADHYPSKGSDKTTTRTRGAREKQAIISTIKNSRRDSLLEQLDRKRLPDCRPYCCWSLHSTKFAQGGNMAYVVCNVASFHPKSPV